MFRKPHSEAAEMILGRWNQQYVITDSDEKIDKLQSFNPIQNGGHNVPPYRFLLCSAFDTYLD